MMGSMYPALPAHLAPRRRTQSSTGLPPDWDIVIFPEPPHGLDIVGPDAQILVTIGPGKPKEKQTDPGTWPGGTGWESWCKNPSWRMCGFAFHTWEEGGWEPFAEDGLALYLDIATRVGHNSFILYALPPDRLGIIGIYLMLTWDSEAGNPRQDGIIGDPRPRNTGSTWRVAPWRRR
jgi:hypothetical protein